MKIIFKISLFLAFLALFFSNQFMGQKAYAIETSLCNTLYGGGEISNSKESCTTMKTPTPTLIQSQPSQLGMVKKPPVLKQTPPTGPESFGIGILVTSGILGYFLKKKSLKSRV